MDFIEAGGDGCPSESNTHQSRTPRKSRRAASSASIEKSKDKKNLPSEVKNVHQTNNFSAIANEVVYPSRMCILSSMLDDSSQAYLMAFAAKFDADVAHNYCDSVTHLVVHTNKNRIIEQRTMKYLKSMSGILVYVVLDD